jgi:putative membrane protein
MLMCIADGVVGIIALLHIWFLVLEMFLWAKPIGLKAFNQTLEKAKATEVLAANQGLYNGFLAAGLIWGVVEPNPAIAFQFKVFFLVCVSAAGIFGAFTHSRKILYIQAIPAFVALAIVGIVS